VFSKGGYGSIPVVIASRILKIPIFIHESDITPGLANRIASHWAKKIFTSFPKTEYFKAEDVICVGNPIRKEILEGKKERAKEIFNLTFEKPIILFLGGSQGSEKINDFVLLVLPELLKDYEVVHQCGLDKVEQVKKESVVVVEKELEKYYHPVGFLNEEETKHILSASDLIVSRAGSGAIFEIAALGKPSILIPLQGSAGNHQAKNALYYAYTGACEVIEEENLSPNFFLEKVKYIFLNLEKMKEEALKFSKPDSAKIIAREILEFIIL
jgi:UDP-N-acetylglucosamine--N-acetylmuramyl-(pentapeptide) pyrophosphoryl-undecaprenol N-acetylglucosamine transferase